MLDENVKNNGFEQTEEPKLSKKKEFKCKNCSQSLVYEPGTTSMKCPYCGTMNEIEASDELIEELDLEEYLRKLDAGGENGSDLEEISTVTCSSCGATITLDPNVVSSECPFCGTKLVLESESSKKMIKPKSVLPFKIKAEEALDAYRKWIKGLWFAPNKLKQYAIQCEQIAGMYIPYWTYDAQTESDYTGLRGDNYTETQTVTINGKTETRTVVRTRWTPVSGHVGLFFDDVLIPASNTVERSKMDSLEPWDLEKLVPYDENYLSGFRAETYQIGLRDGFTDAKAVMKCRIEDEVKYQIGGDVQKINTLSIRYSDTTFKHTLLPIWISAYRFNNKVYKFIVNGRTGKVAGDRPYSWIKITLLVLAIIVVVGGLLYFYQNS